MRLEKEKSRLDAIPMMSDFATVAKTNEGRSNSERTASGGMEQIGIKARLAEKKIEIEKQFQKPKQKKSRDRDCL